AELGVPVRRPDAAALEALRRFDYPGNIRQLENVCQWLTVMAPSAEVGLEDLPPEILDAGDTGWAEPGASSGQGPGPEAAASQAQSGWCAALAIEARARLARREPCVMDELLRDFERTLLRVGLEQAGGRRGEAALRLGIGRNTLTRKSKELGMDPETGPALED
ncbi:helix-turn-helix domain-containing protein, partial [Castellaniella sp.]